MAPPDRTEAALRWERRARELLQRVALDTAGAKDLRDALVRVLEAVCGHTGWPVGHVMERRGDTLVSARLWHVDDPDAYATFRRVTEAFVFEQGVGMPGRVLATRRPVWILDVTQDPNFPRARLATDIGARAAFGFPVLVAGEVVAVLEFFAPTPAEPDEPLLDVMASVGLQLGHLHERMAAEARLVSSEARFRAVAWSATDAIVTVDAAGRVTSWNPAAERMFGWTEAEAVGDELDRIIPAPFRPAHREGMARMGRGEPGRVLGTTVELTGLHRDGSTFPIELSLGTWQSGEGRFYTGVVRDIRQRREAEQRLRDQAARLDAQFEELTAKNIELVRQREDLLCSWRQLEQMFGAFADALPGQDLDGLWHIGHRLGAGGYGVVYRAEPCAGGVPVAVKVFRPANGRLSPSHVARFRREATTATRVDHPNAVRVLDAGVSSAGIPYLVMELLEGRTLGQRLQAEGAVPATIAVPLVSAVASAVAAAHASGIVHRDIKPENVFLHGSDAVPKLLDFGIARLLDDTEDGDRETLTATGQVVGTPAYMAPERLRGAAYDERSDVYSLGVVLYEALTGVHPFERRGGTPWENVRLRANRAVPPLRMGLPAVPPDLEDIVTRALALDPAGRPSAREMATALAAIDPEPLATLARPTSAPRVASATTMDVEE